MSTKYLIFAVLLLIGIGATIGVVGTPWTPRRDVSADIILPSPEVIAMVYASKGFQYLVSYTDTGFEPKDFTINKGETVRFGNNSSHDMWISESSHTAPTVCNDSTSTLAERSNQACSGSIHSTPSTRFSMRTRSIRTTPVS